jgi:nucleotide-binding universal stress UspA family protein
MKTFLVPVDGSAAADAALTLALNLARPSGGELLIVHAINTAAVVAECVTPYGGDPTAALNILEADEQKILDAAFARAREAGITATSMALDGAAAEKIVQVARERHADAIVMGTSGRRGVERFIAGSVAEGVLRTAPVPVFVIHEGFTAAADRAPFRRILVAVDDSTPAGAATRFAIDLAARDGAGIVFCHVVGENEEPPSMLESTQKLAAERGVESATLTVHGRDTAEIIIASAEASRADLIALGTHGRRGLDRFILGSVVEGVVRNSPIPAVVVRGDQSTLRTRHQAIDTNNVTAASCIAPATTSSV